MKIKSKLVVTKKLKKHLEFNYLRMNKVKEIKQCDVKGCCFNAIIWIQFPLEKTPTLFCKQCAYKLMTHKFNNDEQQSKQLFLENE